MQSARAAAAVLAAGVQRGTGAGVPECAVPSGSA